MIRKTITGLAIAASFALPATASATTAAKYTQCADRSYGSGTGNITTRRVKCSDAYRFMRRFYSDNQDNYSGYECKTTGTGYEQYDVRCTASRGRVIHWAGWA